MNKLTLHVFFDEEDGFHLTILSDDKEVSDDVYNNLSDDFISRLEYICNELNPHS